MVDKASHISSALIILQGLDEAGIKEEIAYLPLSYVPAAHVMTVFDNLKKASGEELPTGKRGAHLSQMKLISDERNNGIILMGSSSSIEYVSDFITHSVDRPQESGQSILHTYDLQFLDAQTFAPQLQKVVAAFTNTGSQATQQQGAQGQAQWFKGVQIAAEGVVEGKKELPLRKQKQQRSAPEQATMLKLPASKD